jgi:hypothetical protein
MLRWLIPILVLLNMALFAWGYLQPQPREEAPAPLPYGVPTIRLLSEREQPRPAAATGDRKEAGPQAKEESGAELGSSGTRPEDTSMAGAAAVGLAEPVDHGQTVWEDEHPTRCLRLGPFEQQTTAADAAAGLSAAGHEARLQVKTERRQSGYWVLIPPGTEDPDFVIVNLELAGIQDLWRFSKGALAGAISLGLYSDRKQAKERQNELTDKGFDAEIRPRTVEESGYWIESTYAQGDETAEAALEQLYLEHHWLGYPPPECEEVATP